MTIRLLFFSTLRDIVGDDDITYEIPQDELLVGELLDQLFTQYEGLKNWQDKLLIAINCDYANTDDKISSGDEVAIMPPVQGG